jgi:hypothetical protein
MWWGMNYCDNNSTRSLSSNYATRRGAIAINSQQEVVNHPRAGGQEFALNKWKLKRCASCCCLQLVLGRQVLSAAGGMEITFNEPLNRFWWNTVFGAYAKSYGNSFSLVWAQYNFSWLWNRAFQFSSQAARQTIFYTTSHWTTSIIWQIKAVDTVLLYNRIGWNSYRPSYTHKNMFPWTKPCSVRHNRS